MTVNTPVVILGLRCSAVVCCRNTWWLGICSDGLSHIDSSVYDHLCTHVLSGIYNQLEKIYSPKQLAKCMMFGALFPNCLKKSSQGLHLKILQLLKLQGAV